MMNIKKQRLKTAVVLSATIGIILFVLAFFVAVWWEVTIFTGISVAFKFIFILAGTAAVPACLYYLMKQKNDYLRFCDIYDDPSMKKYPPKIMFISMLKYLAVIFIFTTVATMSYGVGIILAPLLIPACYVIGWLSLYIKLWKYHGYSVSLLMCLSGVSVAASALLSPGIRAGIWAIVKAFLRFSNV